MSAPNEDLIALRENPPGTIPDPSYSLGMASKAYSVHTEGQCVSLYECIMSRFL